MRCAMFNIYLSLRRLGRENFEHRAPEVAVVGLLAVLAKNFLGALRAQLEGQGNLFMHPQGDNLYG